MGDSRQDKVLLSIQILEIERVALLESPRTLDEAISSQQLKDIEHRISLLEEQLFYCSSLSTEKDY